MSKEKIEVGDWVLTSDSESKKYDKKVLQVHHFDGEDIYLTPPVGEGDSWRFDTSGVTKVENPTTHESAAKAREEDTLQLISHNPVSPDHYSYPGGVQVIDLTRHMDFLLGNVVKYVARAGRKGNRLDDLQKAAQYLRWAIEDEESK